MAQQPVLHYPWWLYWAQPLILQFLLWRPFSFAVSLHILQLGDAPEIGVDGHKLDLRVVKKKSKDAKLEGRGGRRSSRSYGELLRR